MLNTRCTLGKTPQGTHKEERPLNTQEQNPAPRTLLLAYLAHALPLEERGRFELRLLEDEFFSRQIEEEEFALVEDFAGGSLTPADRAIVAAWIASSPRQSAQAAITQALARRTALISAKKRNTTTRWLWPLAAAASVAILFAIPHLQHRSTPPQPQLAQATVPTAPAAPHSQPFQGDTILLQAQNLRALHLPATPKSPAAPSIHPGAPSFAASSQRVGSTAAGPTYTLHPGRPIRLQILVPNPQATYTLDLTSLLPHSSAPPIHQQDLRVAPASPLAYLEFQLPPDALPPGPYAAELRSPVGAYTLRFSIAPAAR